LAERYDRDLTDVFDLQDELTRSVVAAIEPNLRSAEIQRARAKPTDSLDAYDLYLRALQERYPSDASGLRDAENLLLQATTIDPLTALGGIRSTPKRPCAACGR
jgi:adenylate cyclase